MLAATCAAVALAVVGVAMAEPSGSGSTATTTTGSSPADTVPAAPVSDARGFPGTAAHCDGPVSAVAYGRTERALVAVCFDSAGRLEYRGARRSDMASLTMPAGRTADGSIVATNDGVTYVVTPNMLLVSEGDVVLYRDDWIEFQQSGPTTAGATDDAGRPTVSTTTVTLPPER